MIRRLVYNLLGRSVYIGLEARRQRRQFSRFRYHDPESRLLGLFIRAGDVCLDVGANLGSYTFYLSRLVGEEGVVYAFEPVPETFEGLLHNLALSRLDNVCALNVGVSNQTGASTVFVPKIHGLPSHGRASLRRTASGEVGEYRAVSLITIDDFYATNHLNRLSFIKMDIEGAELLAVQGARRVIHLHSPVLLLEIELEHTARFGYRPRDLLHLLLTLDYTHMLYWNGTALVSVNIEDALQGDEIGQPSSGMTGGEVYNFFFVPSSKLPHSLVP